jgi:alcohol dehydrogenase (cytochrome c)
LKVCCGLVNRGFAVLGDRLFMATLDAHFVALEMKTGKVIYDIEMAAAKDGFAATGAPLVVKGKVIVGVAGGEYANRGFIDAYDPADGKRVWRFYTIPAPGEPGSQTWQGEIWARGGGPTWLTGTYDPALNLLYWGTGNPNPDWDGDSRPGDNLYTGSLVALDADTGKLKWHYQYTPHDTHDWDANEIPVLADLTINDRPRKVVMMANRNGFFYVNDRVTGEFLVGKPFVNTTWAKEIGSDGRPRVIPGSDPTPEGTPACPDWYGGTNFMSPSFDARRQLFFVTARETCARFVQRTPPPTAGLGDRTMGGTVSLVPDHKRYGALRAIDPTTGERKWEITYNEAGWAGVLATAGGVVFSGDHEGTFFAADSSTGKKLFQFQTGAPLFAPPTSYAIDGRQYVVMPSGANLTAFALPAASQTGSR